MTNDRKQRYRSTAFDLDVVHSLFSVVEFLFVAHNAPTHLWLLTLRVSCWSLIPS